MMDSQFSDAFKPSIQDPRVFVRCLKLEQLFDYIKNNSITLRGKLGQEYRRLSTLPGTEKIPLKTYLHFFEDAAQYLKRPRLGAWLGLQGSSSSLLPLGELFLAAETLYAALLELNRSTIALQSGTQTELHHRAGQVFLSYQIADCVPQACKQDTEFSLMMLFRQLQRRLGSTWSAAELHLAYPLSAIERQQLSQLIGLPVVAEAEMSGLMFDAHWLNHRCQLDTQREELLLFFRQHIAALSHEQLKSSYRQQVEQLLNENLGEYSLSLELVAQWLHLSPRSLQRRLAREQVIFSELLSSVRHRVAMQRMCDPHVRIEALADSLGYADIATFSKAFKRWTGLSPLHYRKQVLREAASSEAAL